MKIMKNIRRALVGFLTLFVLQGNVIAQSAHELLQEGDKAYKKGAYDLAEDRYRKANEKKSSSQANFNLGN